MAENMGFYKSWRTSFQVGWTIYKDQEPYTVLSAGTDFLVLKSSKDGTQVRIFRNTEESLEFTDSPRL